jgi:hypothetical protein
MLKVMLVVLVFLVVLVLGLGIFVLTRLGPDRTPVTLALRLERGRSYALRVEQNTKGRNTIDGRGEAEDSHNVFEYTWLVRKVDERGIATVDVTCDRVQLKDGIWEYDSAKALNEKAGSLGEMAAHYDRDFTMQVSPKGQVIKLEVVPLEDEPTEAEEDAFEPDLSDLPPALRIELEDQWDDMSFDPSRGIIKQLIDDVLGFYPAHEVSVGSEWEVPLPELPVGMELDEVPMLRMTDRRDGVAVIEIDYEFEVEEEGEGSLLGPESKVDMEISATCRVDERTGCIPQAKVDVTGTAFVKMGGNKMEFAIDSTNTFSLTPKT